MMIMKMVQVASENAQTVETSTKSKNQHSLATLSFDDHESRLEWIFEVHGLIRRVNSYLLATNSAIYVTGPVKINHVSANYTELYFR